MKRKNTTTNPAARTQNPSATAPAQAAKKILAPFAVAASAATYGPFAPQNAPLQAQTGSPANPSSIHFRRLTQYLAVSSTMYCKVPAFDTIFVMQAGRKEAKEKQRPTGTNQKQETIKPKYMSLSIKTFALVAMLFTASSTFATTTNDDSNETVKVAFHKDFKKAEMMSAEAKTTYTKVTFKLNDVIMYAFYSDNGQLLAVTRNITSNQLPIQLLLEVKKNYNDCWISDLFELTGDGVSTYYITLENADSKVTLRSNGTDNWETYEKKAK
jgi:hypothetical protein